MPGTASLTMYLSAGRINTEQRCQQRRDATTEKETLRHKGSRTKSRPLFLIPCLVFPRYPLRIKKTRKNEASDGAARITGGNGPAGRKMAPPAISVPPHIFPTQIPQSKHFPESHPQRYSPKFVSSLNLSFFSLRLRSSCGSLSFSRIIRSSVVFIRTPP